MYTDVIIKVDDATIHVTTVVISLCIAWFTDGGILRQTLLIQKEPNTVYEVRETDLITSLLFFSILNSIYSQIYLFSVAQFVSAIFKILIKLV